MRDGRERIGQNIIKLGINEGKRILKQTKKK
jgi:hypothetical protein